MKAAIYARYSSQNQRPESIEDQVAACRRVASQRQLEVEDALIFADEAASGARRDRDGLAALLAASQQERFEVLLVDDLSRLARDNHLMLSIIAELHFHGVRVISVADGLDSDNEESTLGIQIRGIFNELQLRDLKKKTFRGQRGQKERGFSVGERTFGYRSVPVGTIRMDKRGRPRPDGYKMEIEPREAGVVLRVFQSYNDGLSLTAIVRALNEEAVPGRYRTRAGWSPGTVSRMLDNEKYIGRWTWNKSGTRKDPKTGRRRRYAKPSDQWITQEDEALRIVPQSLWDRVRARRASVRKDWPGAKSGRGFGKKQRGHAASYPKHLLSGAMVCSKCGSSVVQVSGKAGGYYGCLAATKGSCDNGVLVRRTLAERKIVNAVAEHLRSVDVFEEIYRRVESEIAALSATVPEKLALKEGELQAEERRLANFIEFIGEGRGSEALAKALRETENRVGALRTEVEAMYQASNQRVKLPARDWIEGRLDEFRSLLTASTRTSALLLRDLLGPVRLEPVRADGGRPHYRAHTAINTLTLLDTPPTREGSEGGSKSLRWWRRRESNPRPCFRETAATRDFRGQLEEG